MLDDRFIVPVELEIIDAIISVIVNPEIDMEVHLTYDGYEPHGAIAGVAIAGKAIAGYIWS